MFENKVYENIHYSRFIASWLKKSKGAKLYKFKEWLRTLIINGKPIPEEVIKEIYNLADNGKLELETSVTNFLNKEGS